MTTRFLDSEPPEPVTLADVRAYLKRAADYTAEDSLFGMLRTSARLTAEKYTGLLFSRRQVEAMFTSDSRRNIRLSFGPDVVIESLTRITTGYPETELTAGVDYNPTGLLFEPNVLQFPRTWRLSMGRLTHTYRAVYRAGYAAGTLPEDLKLAVLQIVANSYRHKGDHVTGNREAKITSIPVHARNILDQYTILVA